MNPGIHRNCVLRQDGNFYLDGNFDLDGGTSLGSPITGKVIGIAPIYGYQLPPQDAGVILWSDKPDPQEDILLQGRMQHLSVGDLAAAVKTRLTGSRVLLELPDGHTLSLAVPPPSVRRLDAWVAWYPQGMPQVTIRAVMEDPTNVEAPYGMVFEAFCSPQQQADLRVLAALSVSLQAQQHLLKVLKLTVKGQKRILLQALTGFSARSGFSDAEVTRKIKAILGKEDGDNHEK